MVWERLFQGWVRCTIVGASFWRLTAALVASALVLFVAIALLAKLGFGYPRNYLQGIAASLRHASIRVADFEETIDEARADDFVFVDPPYTVMHNNNNFVKYNAKLFSWTDQLRLVSAVKRAARRGAAIMVSNADHNSVRELYRDFGTHHHVNRFSALSADLLHRRKTTELLITSYAPALPGRTSKSQGTLK